MLLAIDIGNTNVTFGLHDDAWADTWRLKTSDETQQKLSKSLNRHLHQPVKNVAISSVVPFLTEVLKEQVSKKFKIEPYVITPESYKKLPIDILNPQQIGSDLVADAVAAYEKFKTDCLVVDFGTALTFTLVNDQKIQGVNITPGLKTAMYALSSKAAKLNNIPLELPKSVIGTDTTTAIQAGILWGYVGLVEKMIERIGKEVDKKLKVVATGGLSHVLTALESQFDEVDKNLTLEGIKLIRAYNS